MGKRKCMHTFVGHPCDGDRVVSIMCAVAGCNERLSLGTANDANVPADEIITAVCAHSDADHAAIEEPGHGWDATKPLAEQWPWNGERLYDGLHTRARLAEMDREEDELRAQAIADRKAESFADLTGPTDQGQPVDAELVAYLDSLDGVELPRVESDIQAMERQPLTDAEAATVIAQSSDSFEPRDYAATTPWADPGASTRMTDAELVETVAYAPPGSMRKTCEGPDGEPARHGSNE